MGYLPVIAQRGHLLPNNWIFLIFLRVKRSNLSTAIFFGINLNYTTENGFICGQNKAVLSKFSDGLRDSTYIPL